VLTRKCYDINHFFDIGAPDESVALALLEPGA
jgi:hypothetical protein